MVLVGKKGLSEVITTLLFILLALGAVLMVWFLVRNLILDSGDSADISQLTLAISIKSAEIDEDAKTAEILIERGAGEGNVIGYNFVFEGEDGNSFTKRSDIIIDEFETKRIYVDYSDVETGKIVKIEVYPIIKRDSGKEIMGGPISTTTIYRTGVGEEEPPAPICGDGTLQLANGEECDDGNVLNGDGCSSLCKEEIPAVNNLLLALKFEEATGQPILNSISGGIGAFTSNPDSVAGATAGSGQAIDFDRTGLTSGEYIVADGDLLKGKTAVSASLWFYMDGNAGQISHILFTDFVNSAQRFRIYLNSNRVIQVGVYDTSLRSRSTGQMVFNYGVWYHLVATADTNTDEIKIYLNGIEQSYTGLTPTPLNAFYSPANVGKVYVGAESASGTTVNSPYNGKVDELYIWDKALTQGEILELYNSGAGKFYH